VLKVNKIFENVPNGREMCVNVNKFSYKIVVKFVEAKNLLRMKSYD